MAVEILGWRSWFTNNPTAPGYRVFCSSNISAAAWQNLPDDGHQGTVLYVQRDGGRITRQLLDGCFYIFRWEGPDGVVFSVSNDSKEKILVRYPGAILKRGRAVTLDVFQQISDEMIAAQKPCADCSGG